MPSLVSPFAEVARRPAQAHPETKAQVTLAPLRIHPAYDVQSFDRSGSAGKILAGIFELDPPDLGGYVSTTGTRLIRTDMGRWIINAEGERTDLAAALSPDCAVIDVTHARAGFRLSGAAQDVLRKLLKVDLASDSFPVGRAAELQLHHLGVLLIRLADDAFDIYALSSFAEDIWDAVADAAIEFGYRIEAERDF